MTVRTALVAAAGAALALGACVDTSPTMDPSEVALPPAGDGGECDRSLAGCPAAADSLGRGVDVSCSMAGEVFRRLYHPGTGIASQYVTPDYILTCDIAGDLIGFYRHDAEAVTCRYLCETCDYAADAPPVCDAMAPDGWVSALVPGWEAA